MADPDWLRLVAADLDRYAADLDGCADAQLEPGLRALATALEGAATPHLQDDYRRAIGDVRAAADLIRSGGRWAQAQAEAIEAAEQATDLEDATNSGVASEPVLAF